MAKDDKPDAWIDRHLSMPACVQVCAWAFAESIVVAITTSRPSVLRPTFLMSSVLSTWCFNQCWRSVVGWCQHEKPREHVIYTRRGRCGAVDDDVQRIERSEAAQIYHRRFRGICIRN